MTSGGKETKHSGYTTRGQRETLDEVTGKPTITIIIIVIIIILILKNTIILNIYLYKWQAL